MDAEGRNVRHLGKAGGVGFSCAWSPDGKQIAFIAGGNKVFSIDVDGQNRQQLTKSEEGRFIWELAWSPSGKWIAYIVTQLPNGPINQIFANAVINVVDTTDAGAGKPLGATRGLAPRYLSWVPPASLSVSPSAEKQMTLWGKLKQSNK